MSDNRELIRSARAYIKGFHGHIDLQVGPNMLANMLADVTNALEASETNRPDPKKAEFHAVALEQCAIFAADVGKHIAKAMTDAANFLRGSRPPAVEPPEMGEPIPLVYGTMHLKDHAKSLGIWKNFSDDFDSMSDEEIEREYREAEDRVNFETEWLEAVADWKLAGKPRNQENKNG